MKPSDFPIFIENDVKEKNNITNGIRMEQVDETRVRK
jgi:hypothetical protein